MQWAWAGLSVGLLIASCSVMVAAWYLHLRFTHEWSLLKAVVLSWLIAGGEYMLQVPANRIGAQQAGLSSAQLRGIAEAAILSAFVVFNTVVLRQPLVWNHLIGFGTVLCGVLIVLGGPFVRPIYVHPDPQALMKAEAQQEMPSMDAQQEMPSMDNASATNSSTA